MIAPNGKRDGEQGGRTGDVIDCIIRGIVFYRALKSLISDMQVIFRILASLTPMLDLSEDRA